MDLQIFEHEQFGLVRTLLIDGAVWFVGKDVAAALGYADTDKAIRTHVDEDDKQFFNPADLAGLHTDAISTINSRFGAIFINESGMYALIFGSKLPKAKEFKHWVTAEVLPSIRSKGYYINDKVAAAALDKALDDVEHFTARFQAIFGVSKNIALYQAVSQVMQYSTVDPELFKRLLPAFKNQKRDPDPFIHTTAQLGKLIAFSTDEAEEMLLKEGLVIRKPNGSLALTDYGSRFGKYVSNGNNFIILWRDSTANIWIAD